MRHQLFYLLLGSLCLIISIYVLRIKDSFISMGSMGSKDLTTPVIDKYYGKMKKDLSKLNCKKSKKSKDDDEEDEDEDDE